MRKLKYKAGQCKQQLRRDLGEPLRGGLLSSVEVPQESYVNDEGIESVRPACTVEEPEQVKEALAANGLVKAEQNGSLINRYGRKLKVEILGRK